MQNRRKEKRDERRALIRQSWEEHYAELVGGQITLGEIMGYDDGKLMKLAGKGLRLFKVGKLEPALKIFRGLVILDPWVPYFHYLLGSVYEKLGNLERGLREYSSTLDLTQGVEPQPEIVAFALLGKGRVLGRLGRQAEAIEALRAFDEGRLAGADPNVLAAAKLISSHIARSASE